MTTHTASEIRKLIEDTVPRENRLFTVEPHSRNCLSFWYPKICRVVPTPDTFWVTISDGWRLLDVLEGKPCWYFENLCNILKGAAERVGLPCFLRTGQGSGKHDWKNCCYVPDADAIPRHVCSLVEWSHLVDMAGLPHGTWAVRAMIPTAPVFRCTAYGDMPVVREWRYFIDDGKVLYGIPYWPKGALEAGCPDKADWRDCLAFLRSPLDGGEDLASRVAGKINGRWSVDVLESSTGDLYVTDMAVAESSWGWNDSVVRKR